MSYIAANGLEYKEPGDPSALPEDPQLEELRGTLNNKFNTTCFKVRNHYYCGNDGKNISEHPLVNNLMPFYKRVLCCTLQKAVEENLAAPVTNQLSLLEELALVREVACEPLAEYSRVVQLIENTEAEMLSCDNPATKLTLIKVLDSAKQVKENTSRKVVAALEVVKEFCEKAARIDAMSRDKFSIHTLNSVVAQITRILSDELHSKNLDYIAVDVEEAIRTKLIMPLPETSAASGNSDNEGGSAASVLGTTLTPDLINDTVRAMDEMIPSSTNTGSANADAAE